MANVIELIVKVTDRATSTLQRVTRSIGRALTSIGGLVGGVSLGLALTKVVQATDKQEKAVARLDAVLRSTNNAIGYTTRELRTFASELQNVTTYGDESILELQALLATFTKLRGPVFKEATEVVLNMSQLLGRDFRESAIQVGKALQDPILGVTALRRSGINLTKSQQDVIKSLVETGQTAKAQRIILDELQTEFGGVARAARETFGGALDGLRNAFGDLFELTDRDSGKAAAAIETLTEVLKDPEVKETIDGLVGSVATLFEFIIKNAGRVADAWELAFSPLKFFTDSKLYKDLASTVGGLFGDDQPSRRSSTAPSRASRARESGRDLRTRLAAEDEEALRRTLASIQPFEIKVKPLVLTDEITQQLLDLREGTLTPIEREAEDLKAALNETDAIISLLEDRIRGGATELQKTLDLARQIKSQQLDSGLQEFNIEEIRSRKLPTEVGQRFEEIAAFSERASQRIQDTFVDAFKSIGNGTDGMVESFANAFKEIILQAAALDLVKALGLDKIFSGGGSGGGGFLGSIFGGLFRAGGGYASKPFVAGESGAELVVPSGLVRVFNQRQLATAGSGGVAFAPTTNIAITARADDANTLRREFITVLAENNKVQQRELARMLERNGYGRMRG